MAWGSLCLAACISLSWQIADSEFDQLLAQQMAVNDLGRASQEKIDTLDRERQNLIQQRLHVEAQIEAAERYVAQVNTLIADQERELASFQQQLAEVGKTNRRIVPLLLDMIDRLDALIDSDMPFLVAERKARVGRVRDAMDSADVPTAEKARLVLQAYRIEADYGRGLAVFQGELPGDGRVVDFLRIGRVSLLYRSLDGYEAGFWDKETASWVLLDGSYRHDIDQAFRIANGRAAPNLLRLPVPPAEGESR